MQQPVSPEVARALRPWFAGITLGTPTTDRDAPAVLEKPDHATTLVWLPGSGGPDDILIMGPRVRARYLDERPAPDCLQLRFRPGRAAEFLGLSLRGLADRAVLAGDLDSGPLRALVRGIPHGGSPAVPRTPSDRLRTLARLLPAASSAPDDRTGRRRHLIATATAMLSTGAVSPAERVAHAARRLHVSERHLRTLFIDGVGLTPSRFARIDRLRTVLARIGGRLPELAADAGFYDQSHLNTDFRRIMGTTPHAFATRRWPAAAPPCPADG